MSSSEAKSNARNTGLDILRILAMLGIVTLHLLGHGGILENFGNAGINGDLLWLLESISYFSVNIFVLISGCFLCQSKFKFNKFIRLVAEITFWSLISFCVYFVFNGFSLTVAIKSLFSCYFGVYWFATVYLGLYLLSPFLNKLIQHMSKQQFVGLLVVMTVLSCFPLLNVALKISSMSLFWFVTLYLYGAFFRIYEIKANSVVCVLMVCLSVCVLWLSKVIDISAMKFVSELVWAYHSIITLLGSVGLFLLFTNMRFKNTKLTNIIGVISMGTFGVYLIHDNSYTRDFLWGSVRKVFEFDNTGMLMPKVLVCILLVFCTCWIVDCVRRYVFKLLHINQLLDKISEKLVLVWTKVLKKDNN